MLFSISQNSFAGSETCDSYFSAKEDLKKNVICKNILSSPFASVSEQMDIPAKQANLESPWYLTSQLAVIAKDLSQTGHSVVHPASGEYQAMAQHLIITWSHNRNMTVEDVVYALDRAIVIK